MTKEQVEKRLNEAMAEREKLLANVNMIAGVIADCEYWLSQFDEKPQPEPDPE